MPGAHVHRHCRPGTADVGVLRHFTIADRALATSRRAVGAPAGDSDLATYGLAFASRSASCWRSAGVSNLPLVKGLSWASSS